ncbi:hypothetical protein [Streptomyces sp. NPDC053367]|uniref:hypothetical protein n=1 Tax=Streptomyces sp. NPDC053367 TaxID=3365700 RepID=UPI0037CF65DC
MTKQRFTVPSSKAMRAFQRLNPEFDLLSFDFHDHGAVRALRWQGTDPEKGLAGLMAMQRVMRLTGSEETSRALLAVGIHSAHQIGAVSE